MTLRTRLVVAFVAVAVILAGALAVVGVRQRQVLTDQLDAQLQALSRNAWRLASGGAPGPPPGLRVDVAVLPAGAYVGAFRGGELVEVASAEGQPAPVVTEPALAAARGAGATEPFTAPAVGGGAKLRVVGVRVDDGWVVVALSARQVEAATRQLLLAGGAVLAAVLGVLALLSWWVIRLGLRPIRELTQVTERIARGDLAERAAVDVGETEAARLAAAFNAMVDARQQAEQTLRQFVADASHELRTPLTTLRGYAALHAAGGVDDPDAVADAMRRIGQEAERMGGLVDDLLLLASLDEKRPLELGAVDLARIVSDAASDAAAVQPGRSVVVDAAEPVVALADASRIRQVVSALVANALVHTPADARLELAARSRGATVEVTVRDHGPGIAPEHAGRVFERFYRADPARPRARGGSGLGLSIVRAVVEAHGGSVSLDTAPGRGTAFTVILPAA